MAMLKTSGGSKDELKKLSEFNYPAASRRSCLASTHKLEAEVDSRHGCARHLS
jgi:hypothetical protein